MAANDYLKGGLLFAAGAAVGAVAVVALSKGKLDLKPAAAGLVSGALNLRDKTLTVFEKAKEGVEDVVAEAQHRRTKTAVPGEGNQGAAS